MAPPARSVKRMKFEPESVQKALVNVIITNELPFTVVENEEFRVTMETEFSGFQVPSSETICSVCAQFFMDEKLKLKSLIKRTKQRVCLSLDTWTSNQSVTYLCITAHTIDDNWNLYKKIIGFTPICKDNGEEMGRVVETCLNDWGINNVLAISAGNASSYDAAVSYLGTRLVNPLLDDKCLRVKCFVELNNTMIKGVLKDFNESIVRARAMVRCVLQPPGRIKRFEQRAREYVREMATKYDIEYARHLGIASKSFLTLDCPSRWTSTFEMLRMVKKLDMVFYLFENENPNYMNDLSNTRGVLDSADWRNIDHVVYFLKDFHRLNEKMLASRVTSYMFLDEIDNIETHLEGWAKSFKGSGEHFFKAMNLYDKFEGYWGIDVESSNMLIYIASILDPRQKTFTMEFYFANRKYRQYADEGEGLWKEKAELVVGAAYDLYNEYVGKMGVSHQTANFKTSGYMDFLYTDIGPRVFEKKCKVGLGGNAGRATEIDIYLHEHEYFEDYDGFDVLVWWKVNSERFPVLSKMAKDVLAIPIFAVPLESDINVDGNLLDDFKSSLSPSMLEALVCTQDWTNKPKRKIEMKDGSSTKLADKILKGVYEQLEGATSGSR